MYLDLILNRRSIRRFTSRSVSDDVITKLIKAAMSAPSAHNQQPWEFIVINDQAILEQIPQIHPYSSATRKAPMAILICGNQQLITREPFWPQDCSAATQNLLLAAHASGLGAVWMGIYPLPERVADFSRLLNLPEHIIPFSLIPLGYPAEQKRPANRFDPERIHYNGWA